MTLLFSKSFKAFVLILMLGYIPARSYFWKAVPWTSIYSFTHVAVPASQMSTWNCFSLNASVELHLNFPPTHLRILHRSNCGLSVTSATVFFHKPFQNMHARVCLHVHTTHPISLFFRPCYRTPSYMTSKIIKLFSPLFFFLIFPDSRIKSDPNPANWCNATVLNAGL